MRGVVVVLWLAPALARTEPREPGSVTLEAGLGAGVVRLDHFVLAEGSESPQYTLTTDPSLAATVGVGVWHTANLALSVRATVVDIRFTNRGVSVPYSGRVIDAAIGPGVQYWFDRHFWFGVGLNAIISDNVFASHGAGGTLVFGPDARAGYALGDGPHAWTLSVDGSYGFKDTYGSALTLVLLAGYQLL